MAVEFKVEHTRSSEYLFAPKDIKFKPELNGRHELPDIEWLIDSMVRNGQLQPVLVRNDGGFPVLVAGFSRWRAAVEINKRKLTPAPFKLRCVYFKGSEQHGLLANISENRERNSTTPIDDGYNICRLERYGMTLEEIAAIYHEDPPWCKKRMALVSLTPEAQAAVKNGKVKPNAVVALAKLSEAEQRRCLEEAKSAGRAITSGSLKPKADKRLTVRELLKAGSCLEDLPFEYQKTGGVQGFCERVIDYLSNGVPF